MNNETMMESENNAQMPEPQAAPAQPDEREFVKCPCCGKMTLVKPVRPGADLMDHFMSCMLTGTPYKHTYELYGGKVRITVTQITTDSRHYVLEACSLLDRWRDLLQDRFTQTEDIKDIIRTYSCIVDISVDNGQIRTFYPAEAMKTLCNDIAETQKELSSQSITLEDIRTRLDTFDARAKDPAATSSLPSTMLLATFQLHSQLYQIMMDAGFDENFWARIKLD